MAPLLAGLVLLCASEVRLEALRTPRGVLLPGEQAAATVVVDNPCPEPRTVWVGYSVQGPDGAWRDVASHAVTLEAGARSVPQRKAWPVPTDAPVGFYRVVVAAWSGPPEAPGATRLAAAERRDAFRVALHRAPGDRLDTETWERGDHPLGRGGVAAPHVDAGARPLALVLPRGEHGGAEIRTAERVGHGVYSARLRTPRAPGSLTAFFLYQDVPGGNDEVDIEIYNDGSRRVLFSVWVGGDLTQQAEVRLPFDPADGFHDYVIDHGPGRLAFRVDGVEVARWHDRLPTRSMRVALNAWWPAWLDGPVPARPVSAEVERVGW